jgi:hypothetical protein
VSWGFGTSFYSDSRRFSVRKILRLFKTVPYYILVLSKEIFDPYIYRQIKRNDSTSVRLFVKILEDTLPLFLIFLIGDENLYLMLLVFKFVWASVFSTLAWAYSFYLSTV